MLGLGDPTSCVADHQPERGRITAKRKKGSKVQKRAKLPKQNSVRRGKARKAAQAKTVARAKPKRATVKKAVRTKQPVAPAVETVAVEVIEQPVAVTEVEETRKAS